MYDVKRYNKQFRLSSSVEVAELNDIENNPLCSVTNKQFITTEQKEFANGKLANTYQEVICILEWNEKVLVE